jgi:hypothetical protein
LFRFPNMTLYTNYFDPHFYILSHWTLEVLEKYKDHMSSLKGDLIPFLIKCQYKRRLLKGINHFYFFEFLSLSDFCETMKLTLTIEMYRYFSTNTTIWSKENDLFWHWIEWSYSLFRSLHQKWRLLCTSKYNTKLPRS